MSRYENDITTEFAQAVTRYMVCLDGSLGSEWALKTAIHIMNKKTDELYLMAVTEKLANRVISPAFFTTLDETQKALEKETERMLRRFGRFAKARGVRK